MKVESPSHPIHAAIASQFMRLYCPGGRLVVDGSTSRFVRHVRSADRSTDGHSCLKTSPETPRDVEQDEDHQVPSEPRSMLAAGLAVDRSHLRGLGWCSAPNLNRHVVSSPYAPPQGQQPHKIRQQLGESVTVDF